jgi:hypothetical protein
VGSRSLVPTTDRTNFKRAAAIALTATAFSGA